MNDKTENEISILCENPIAKNDDYTLQMESMKVVSQKFEFSISVFVKENFYYLYNFFVQQYNEDVNRVDDKYMKKLKCLIFTTLPDWRYYVCWILCSIFPMVSVAAFIYNLLRFLTLIKIILTLKENKANIHNPFKKMIYCKTLLSANEYYFITTKIYTQEIQQLGVTIDCFNYVVNSFDESVITLGFKLMFYNDQFVRHYTRAPKAVCFDMCLTSTLLIISFISGLSTIVGFSINSS